MAAFRTTDSDTPDSTEYTSAGPSSTIVEAPTSQCSDRLEESGTPETSIPPSQEPPEHAAHRAALLREFDELFQPVPPELPPFWDINHTIPIIDEKKRYNYRLPKCPEVLRPELSAKIERYVKAGWWEPRLTDQAAPLLCVYKKDGRLRTVVDLRQRNDNTVKDVTPFPDQDQIRNDVARAKFRSKLDMSDAYEQTRIADEDVAKTGFSTIYGTFVSRVMQQGDCNAPSTFQRLMTHIFRERIGKTIHVYLDDIFIFTDTLEEHLEVLRWVFDRLRVHKLYLSVKKADILSTSMDCLGHMVDHQGLHADSDKMIRIRDWPVPKTWHDVQRFLGLVQYLAHFMPDASAYTGPLSSMMRNGQAFYWRPLHQKCFDEIKALACKAPILKPIDVTNPDPIWVVTDTSYSGVGAMYGQGPTWETCRPAGFMSKKFTSAQFSYFTFEQEALAVVEALLKWEEKLIGRRFTIVTDHRSLSFMKEKRKIIPRLQRWMEYIGRFDFQIQWVEGLTNRVADALSRYYSSEEANTPHPPYDLVDADVRLDPEGDTLDNDRVLELRAVRIVDKREDRDVEADDLARYGPPRPPEPSEAVEDDPTAAASTGGGPALEPILAADLDLRGTIRAAYGDDSFFRKIVNEPTAFPRFKVEDDLVWHMSREGQWVLGVPRAHHNQRLVTEIITAQAHATLGHLGHRRTSDYVRRWFWWPSIGSAIERFCRSCGTCQTTKTSNSRPAGLLHSLPLPDQPWDSIAMDFVGPFPECDGFDYLWVIVDRFSGTVHLIPTTTTVRASALAWLFLKEIVRLHGLPTSIVSDRDSKFISKFWRDVHRMLGTKLHMSTSYHPQTDGKSERTIRTTSQMLRAMVQHDQRDWARKLPMVEFAINASRSSSSGFAPFELTGGFMPRMIADIGSASALPGVQEFAERAVDYVRQAHDALIASRVDQTFHANRLRRSEQGPGADQYAVGGQVYLSTANLNLPKGRARKLMPKFIGPYRVLRARPETSTYTLDLPGTLTSRGIFPTFHVSKLRPHEPNDENLFPHRDVEVFYDFGDDPEREFVVDGILAHEWRGRDVAFLVQWAAGDTTWEPLAHVRDLEALDRYYEVLGVEAWTELPRPLPRRTPGSAPGPHPVAVPRAQPTDRATRPEQPRSVGTAAVPRYERALPVPAPPRSGPADANVQANIAAGAPARRSDRPRKPRVRTS
ncbi:hypothetical protein VTO73DRAFT_14488 [Trametes versicolor]